MPGSSVEMDMTGLLMKLGGANKVIWIVDGE